MKFNLSKTNATFIMGLLIMLFMQPVATLAAEYVCYKPGQAGGFIKHKKPSGRWRPWDNTANYEYVLVGPGRDLYRHKTKKRNRATTCNQFTYKVDYQNKQDWCLKYQQAMSASLVQPTCPSGYTLSSDKRLCVKPATAAYWKKVKKPSGRWRPYDNTGNYYYRAIPGKDSYRHKKRNRERATTCGKLSHRVDFQGYQDWCSVFVAAQPKRTRSASCPSGYSLRLNTPGLIKSGFKSVKKGSFVKKDIKKKN